MDTLPDEVLVEIFLHLSITDLVSLSKASGRFRFVIDTTTRLKFFTLRFDKRGKIHAQKTRRFAELTVEHYSARLHQPLLLLCGANITSASFIGASPTYAQIAAILRLTPALKQVRFENCSLWPEVLRQLPELRNNLHVQLVESSACVLDLFLRSTVHALSIVSHAHEHGTGIRSFLAAQPRLASLSCKGARVLDNFFAAGNSFGENLKILPFRLKILVLRNVAWREIYFDLLLPSASSLTYLELGDVTPTHAHERFRDFINACERLEELWLGDFCVADLNLANLRKITLSGRKGDFSFVERLPRLKNLRILGNFTRRLDLTASTDLTEVELRGDVMQWPLVAPHVRKLIIGNFTTLPNEGFFTRDLAKIEEIELSQLGDNTETVLRAIAERARGVKTLKVSDGNCSKSVLVSVRQKLTRLENFVTRNLVECE